MPQLAVNDKYAVSDASEVLLAFLKFVNLGQTLIPP